jgi:plasmid stability protein
MATLQVKNMDDELYKVLGRRAKLDNRSISQEVVLMIENYLAQSFNISEKMSDEVLKLAGSWSDSRSEKEISESIRTARNSIRFQESL